MMVRMLSVVFGFPNQFETRVLAGLGNGSDYAHDSLRRADIPRRMYFQIFNLSLFFLIADIGPMGRAMEINRFP